ncbi:MAG: acyl carrier protein [Actinobacteria bacterium]|nr:acyl carrier protein [Actinomycetota bacterium]
MDREEILNKIQEITADRLGVDESDVTPDASFREDLEADSLDLVELIMELEEQFGMEIPASGTRPCTARAASGGSRSSTPRRSPRRSPVNARTSTRPTS